MFIESEAVEIGYRNLKKFIEEYSKADQDSSIKIEIINYQIRMLF